MHEARKRGWNARLTKKVSLNVMCRAEFFFGPWHPIVLDHTDEEETKKGKIWEAPHVGTSASPYANYLYLYLYGLGISHAA